MQPTSLDCAHIPHASRYRASPDLRHTGAVVKEACQSQKAYKQALEHPSEAVARPERGTNGAVVICAHVQLPRYRWSHLLLHADLFSRQIASDELLYRLKRSLVAL